MYKKKGNQTGSALGDVKFCLSSGFDEFEFNTELPLECLLENQSISDDEYREIWINTPKDEHILTDLKISYSKVIEGI
jgi:hypothetical protein